MSRAVSGLAHGDGERCGREGLQVTEPPGSRLTERTGAQAPSPPALAPRLAPLLRGSQREVSAVLSLLLQWLSVQRAGVARATGGPCCFLGAGNQGPSPCPVGTQGCGSTRHPQPSPSLPWAGPWWRSPWLLSALCMTLFYSCYQERARFGPQGLPSCAGPRLQGSPSSGPVGTAAPQQRPGASSANCPSLPWSRGSLKCGSAQVSSAAEPPGPR